MSKREEKNERDSAKPGQWLLSHPSGCDIVLCTILRIKCSLVNLSFMFSANSFIHGYTLCVRVNRLQINTNMSDLRKHLTIKYEYPVKGVNNFYYFFIKSIFITFFYCFLIFVVFDGRQRTSCQITTEK